MGKRLPALPLLAGSDCSFLTDELLRPIRLGVLKSPLYAGFFTLFCQAVIPFTMLAQEIVHFELDLAYPLKHNIQHELNA